MHSLLLKEDCDTCGCAWNWAGAGAGGGGHSDWETIDSTIVSAASPNWNFGARGAGIWKITSEQVYEAANNLPLTWFSYFDDLNWNSGGVTLDNSGGRDRSHHHQFYDVTNRYLQPNGHYSFGCAPRLSSSASNWGKGFDETGANANVAHQSGYTYTTDGQYGIWSGDFRWRILYTSVSGRAHYTPRNCGAVFVWMSDVNHYALPAKITGDASDTVGTWNPSGNWPAEENYAPSLPPRPTKLQDIFRRQILPHTGTISGSISDVTADQRHTNFDLSSQRWQIRLHKLAPTPDTVWLENRYAKRLRGLRLKRWSGHIGAASTVHCAWAFPLWHYDIIFDSIVPANMGTCNLHHFTTSGGLGPYTWTPESDWGVSHAGRGSPMTFAGTDDYNPTGVGSAGAVGVVRAGAWSAWTVTPIFEDNSHGEEQILGAEASRHNREDGLSPLGNAGGDLGYANTHTNRRGCGFRSPTYLRGSMGNYGLGVNDVGVGTFAGTRAHQSMGVKASGEKIGGVPVCVDFGVIMPDSPLRVRADSAHLDTDGEAVSF